MPSKSKRDPLVERCWAKLPQAAVLVKGQIYRFISRVELAEIVDAVRRETARECVEIAGKALRSGIAAEEIHDRFGLED